MNFILDMELKEKNTTSLFNFKKNIYTIYEDEVDFSHNSTLGSVRFLLKQRKWTTQGLNI